MKKIISNLSSKLGFSVSRQTEARKIQALIDKIEKIKEIPLQRIGGDGDGGYWIPQNLNGISCCFSPGVAGCSAFEQELAEKGIEIFMADKSVDRPAIENPRFHFIQKHIGSFTDSQNGFISFEDWYNQSNAIISKGGDKILQMDIEGFEYEVIHSIPQKILNEFRVLVIEFHNLHQLLNCNSFDFMERSIQKILLNFDICRLENNLFAGSIKLGNKTFGRLLEVTFLRK